MTTYPGHRLHFGRPHPRPWLVVALALAAAAVGAGAWALVDHFGGSSGISDSQAITFIQTGEGLPGLNVVNGNPNLHGSALPAAQRTYALAAYRSGPYRVHALNLFYAVGAATTHGASAAERQAIVGVGRTTLIEQAVARANAHPSWITQYGVTVHDAAAALVRGLLAGAGS